MRTCLLLLLLVAGPALAQPDTPASLAPVEKELALGLPGYLSLALEHSAEARAAHEQWQAAVLRIPAAATLPEPTLSFGVFVREVETRVGPQRARLGIQQAFPFPTALTAGTDAASAEARAAEARFRAAARSVRRAVEADYWRLWELRRARQRLGEHAVVLESLAEAERGRMTVGQARLADVQQVELARARLDDRLLGLDAAAEEVSAALRSRLGLREALWMPTPDAPPDPALPVEGRDELVTLALEHPRLDSHEERAGAAEARARAAGAQRLPTLKVGADWIVTGAARAPDVQDSGKDAVVVGLGLSLPLWQRAYGAEVESYTAQARAERELARGEGDAAVAAVDARLARVRETARRVQLREERLLPQAEAAFASLLGAEATGGGVAQVLMASRELLDLGLEADTARADHARAWADLEETCGAQLARRPAGGTP